MRITNQMMTGNLIQHVEDNLTWINSLREQISSGKQFQNPSDDPVDASLSIQLKSSLNISQGYQQSAVLIRDWMNETEFSLKQLEELGEKAKNLLIRGMTDTMDENERTTSLATELSEMIKQTVDLGNTKFQGNYIFSGVRLDHQAFELTSPSSLSYQGISKAMMRSIGQSAEMVLNINGDEAIAPLINAMIEARDNLLANNSTDFPASLDKIKNTLENLINYRTGNGARMKQLDTVIDYLKKSDINIIAMISEKEDVNLAEAYTFLTSRENTYQAVLEVGNRTISALNLFDYLQ